MLGNQWLLASNWITRQTSPMQRSHLAPVLASLGLACAPERGQVVEPEPSTVSEPSGLGHAAKPETPEPPTPIDPHFEGVPTRFCHATVQQRDETLLRTESFLAAWNELAPATHDPHAQNIPTTEIDARSKLCGTEPCSIGAQAKLTEVVVDNVVNTGALIPSEGGMLVVPELARPHAVGSLTTEIQLQVERHERFVHVRAIVYEWEYAYASYGDDEYPMRELGRLSRTFRRDFIIDEEDGELELMVEQSLLERDAPPRMELAFEQGGIVLSGCESTLELQWVE
jgi:hypothetical protein